MNEKLSETKWRWCPLWLGLAALTIICTGCETFIDGMLDSPWGDDGRKSYEHYYEHGGCDRQTAAKKANFDVLWDRESAQH